MLLLQTEQGRRMAKQESKLTEGCIAIMLSQIQPYLSVAGKNAV